MILKFQILLNRITCIGVVFAFAVTSADGLDAQLQDPFQQTINRVLDPVPENPLSALDFLKSMASDTYDTQRVDKLIEQLGSPIYEQRQQAQSELNSVPILTLDLESLTKNIKDPETRYRLLAINRSRKPINRQLLEAALKSAKINKLRAAVVPIKQIVKRGNYPRLRVAFRDAFTASTTVEDSQMLREFLKDENPFIRRWSALALLEWHGSAATDWVGTILDDPSDQTRMMIAIRLVDLNHRPAVDTLAALLTSDDRNLRFRSWNAIKILTGHNLGNLPYADDQQTKLVEACRNWLTANKDTFVMQIPLSEKMIQSSRLHGNTLVGVNGKDIIEYDAAKNKVFQLEHAGLQGVDKTAEGTYIVHSYNNEYLREIDAEGNVLWEITGKGFNNAIVTQTGTVLTTIGSENLVQEYDRATQEVIWEKTLSDWTNSATRLENGNTLIADHSGVVELDAAGEQVWKFPTGDNGTCVACQPLSNGNVLIGWTSGTIKEVDRDKQIVWNKTGLGNIHDLHRDELGNTLVLSSGSLTELSPTGEVTWTVELEEAFGTVKR